MKNLCDKICTLDKQKFSPVALCYGQTLGVGGTRGMSDAQEYDFEPDEQGAERILTLRSNEPARTHRASNWVLEANTGSHDHRSE
jgi:hypothetical protein